MRRTSSASAGERFSGGAACGRCAGRIEQGVRPRNLRAGARRQRRQDLFRVNCQSGFSPRGLPSERTWRRTSFSLDLSVAGSSTSARRRLATRIGGSSHHPIDQTCHLTCFGAFLVGIGGKGPQACVVVRERMWWLAQAQRRRDRGEEDREGGAEELRLWRSNGSCLSDMFPSVRFIHLHHRLSAAVVPRCASVVVLVLVLRESVKTQEGRGEPIGPGLDNPAVVGRLALSCTSGSALSGPEGG